MNVENELTLLTDGQIWGNDNEEQLEVLKKYGTKSAISDLVMLTGGFYDKSHDYRDDDVDTLKNRTGWSYTRSLTGKQTVSCVNLSGYIDHIEIGDRESNIRPVLLLSSDFSQILSNRVEGYNGTEEVEYGEYPQYAPDKHIQSELEREYKNKKLKLTGGKYTFENSPYNTNSQGFQAVTYEEYEYNGKKYIRVKANLYKDPYYGYYIKLSNGEKYKNGDYVWVEVSPVKWLIDNKTGLLVSKIGLLAGIRFDAVEKEYNGDFSETEMKEYLDKYMSKDLLHLKK